MSHRKPQSGFTLLEVLIALILVGLSMTSLVIAFVASGQFGVLARRQATAMMLARSLATTLSHVPYTDPRLQNVNTANDGTFADPAGLFGKSALPTGSDIPDLVLPTVTVGNDTYEEYVNIAADPVTAIAASGIAPAPPPPPPTESSGIFIAVIVRYKVGGRY
ncbi:MAG TPA: prepilin-type N-terminal cleavage/methylation domain-containing protein, partial [Myxococcales bacterium]|nr:prepilin-type N-terminal cleavage/methylation domain-containing protein [Myxococcales bacterium]